jgi:hypothetical protein
LISNHRAGPAEASDWRSQLSPASDAGNDIEEDGKVLSHQAAQAPRPSSKLETAFHRADHSIQHIIQLLEVARIFRSFLAYE